MTHLFVEAVSRGGAVPAWFNEGLAGDSEVVIGDATRPANAEAHIASSRRRVLDALAERGPHPLLQLDEMDSGREWNANFADGSRMLLQYAQAHELVRALNRSKGRPATWAVLRAVAAGRPFAAAFAEAYGSTPQDSAAAIRESWAAELRRPVPQLTLRVRIAAASVGDPASLTVNARTQTGLYIAFGSDVPPGEYLFTIEPDGSLTDPAGVLNLTTRPSEPIAEIRGRLSVIISRGELIESDAYHLDYGRWAPDEDGRTLFTASDDLDEFVEIYDLSAPFPSGDEITIYSR
jgi:hypothetical protein